MLILATCQQETYKIGTSPTSQPFDFLENDKYVGFDADFAKALAEAGDFQYEIVQAPTFTDLFDRVKNEEVDFALSGITINDERKQTYDFSVPYYVSGQRILTKEGSGIEDAQDLIGKNVAVVSGTTGEAAIQQLLGADSPNIKRVESTDEGLAVLGKGEVDAFVRGKFFTEYYAKNNADYVSIRDDNTFSAELFGLMFPKGSEMIAEINVAITAVLENGDYAKIYNDWFGASADADVDILLRAGKLEDPYDVYNEK
jgi:polar amino acid transport system substrate-binding protein